MNIYHHPVLISFDKESNAAMLYLTGEATRSGGVAKTYCCDPVETGAMINLDFDDDGRLIAIEVLDAKHVLPAVVLAENEQSGP